jgi:hypothetical protein
MALHSSGQQNKIDKKTAFTVAVSKMFCFRQLGRWHGTMRSSTRYWWKREFFLENYMRNWLAARIMVKFSRKTNFLVGHNRSLGEAPEFFLKFTVVISKRFWFRRLRQWRNGSSSFDKETGTQDLFIDKEEHMRTINPTNPCSQARN